MRRRGIPRLRRTWYWISHPLLMRRFKLLSKQATAEWEKERLARLERERLKEGG